MRILVVGATGLIGSAIVKELTDLHEIIKASRESGDVQVDMADEKSIQLMYERIGHLDAVIIAAGGLKFRPLDKMLREDYEYGLQNKLMGQALLVMKGIPFMNEKGSFTLTSGILNQDPIVTGSSAAMVNGGINGFVKSAAIEMPRGIRINAVSPTVIQEAMDKFGDFFPGFLPVPVSRVALAYKKSVEGAQTGQVYCVH